jgi:hypothetical protein
MDRPVATNVPRETFEQSAQFSAETGATRQRCAAQWRGRYRIATDLRSIWLNQRATSVSSVV